MPSTNNNDEWKEFVNQAKGVGIVTTAIVLLDQAIDWWFKNNG